MNDQSFEQFLNSAIEIIKERRKELGLTQDQLAQRIGKPQSVIGRLESGGVSDPRISMFFQVCKGLDLDPAEVLSSAAIKKSREPEESSKLKKIREELSALEKKAQEQVKMIEGIIKLV